MQLAAVILGLSLLIGAEVEGARRYQPRRSNAKRAFCKLTLDPNTSFQLNGFVNFTQFASGRLGVHVSVDGFPTQTTTLDHGMHVHANGNITGGCAAAGGHYNPEGVDHASPFSPVRHVGDFGNIRQDPNGRVNIYFQDYTASLVGDNTIIGRGLVIHEGTDDLGLGGNDGSLASGNAGARAACCVITKTPSA